MWVKNPDSLSLVINFLITPMTFFCGSFFPIHNLPTVIKGIVKFLPLSLANDLLRMNAWTIEAIYAMGILVFMALLMFLFGVYQLSQYTESVSYTHLELYGVEPNIMRIQQGGKEQLVCFPQECCLKTGA